MKIIQRQKIIEKSAQKYSWGNFYCLGCGWDLLLQGSFWKRSIFTFKTRKKGRSHPPHSPFQVKISETRKCNYDNNRWMVFAQDFESSKKTDVDRQLILTLFFFVPPKMIQMIDSRNLKLELFQNTCQFMERINFNLAHRNSTVTEMRAYYFQSEYLYFF